MPEKQVDIVMRLSRPKCFANPASVNMPVEMMRSNASVGHLKESATVLQVCVLPDLPGTGTRLIFVALRHLSDMMMLVQACQSATELHTKNGTITRLQNKHISVLETY